MNELTTPAADELIRNIQYHQAQKAAELLLSEGLISPAEYAKITDINRMTYLDFLDSSDGVLRNFVTAFSGKS